jgi:methionyl aminopeptidase
MFGRKIEVKSQDELRRMRAAGLVVARTLEVLGDAAGAGMTTGDLDDLAEKTITGLGGTPSFPLVPGYRHTLCVSVNEQVVHGIPGDRVLHDGDLVSIDCGAIVDGWHGDAAITLVVGGREQGRAEDLALSDATRASLWAGIAAFRPGRPIRDIGGAVEDTILEYGAAAAGGPYEFGIVEGYEGHGIGREMHMAPAVPNYRTRDKGPTVRVGATVAIEPMITLGSPDTRELADQWTVVTLDGRRAAHWEHTVAATEGGLWVLTSLDGGAADLAAIGAPYGPAD